MNIRPIVPADGADLVALFEQVFTASEGAEEGAALGTLVGALLAALGDDVQGYLVSQDDKLLAAIFFSRMVFEDGTSAWLLSPVAVATAVQGQGVGQQLIRYGMAALAGQDAELVVTYGDPAFYSRVGFTVIGEDIISPPYALSQPHGWQCCSLTEAPIQRRPGTARCVPAFSDPALW